MVPSKPTILRSARRCFIDSAELPSIAMEPNCMRQVLPVEAGNGYSNIFVVDPMLSIIETRYSLECNLSVLSRSELPEPKLVVTLGLEGRSGFHNREGDDLLFRKGYSTITRFTSSMGERVYEAGSDVSQLRLSVNQSWLEMYFDRNVVSRLFEGPDLKLLAHHPTSYHSQIAAQQIFGAQVPNSVRNGFLKGQALTILACEVGALLLEIEGNAFRRCNARDEAIVSQSKEILVAEYRNPPTLEELAKRVGTNEFKLKQLFHRHLNRTPYGVVLETRMAHAHRLLETRRYSVAIVAELVGYRHASNFSTAFNKYFGISPRSLVRNC